MKKVLLGIIGIVMCISLSCTPRSVSTPVEKTDKDLTLWEASSDAWRTSTPEEQGIDSALILEMLQEIQEQGLDFHSVLLICNDHLVTEVYFPPYYEDFKHPVYSVSKSITSALVGIVAVFTSGLADPDFPMPKKLLESFALPAATSADPLPASPVTDDLQAYIEQVMNPEPQPVPPLPETAM